MWKIELCPFSGMELITFKKEKYQKQNNEGTTITRPVKSFQSSKEDFPNHFHVNKRNKTKIRQSPIGKTKIVPMRIINILKCSLATPLMFVTKIDVYPRVSLDFSVAINHHRTIIINFWPVGIF